MNGAISAELMSIMFDVLIRHSYLGWAPLQVKFRELINGGRQVDGHEKHCKSVCIRLKCNNIEIHQVKRMLFTLMLIHLYCYAFVLP
jgi:hypothetical protein